MALEINEQLLNQLCAISFEAGQIEMEYHQGLAEDMISTKGDQSPVTLADKKADDYICQQLAKLSDYLIVSEEGNRDFSSYNVSSKPYWLVDPLDGTKEFIKGIGEFSTNIALIEKGIPILGVVYAPALGQMYAAARGMGLWYSKDYRENKEIAVVSEQDIRAQQQTNTLIMTSRNDDWRALSQGCDKPFKAMGSSLKFAEVALGKAHSYVRRIGSYPWDVAAGEALCIYALDKDGNKKSSLTYADPCALNEGFVIEL